MPRLYPIPDISDPCWTDANWRSETLSQVCTAEALTQQEVSRLTGASTNTVRFWLSNHSTTRVGASTLRALLYDLNARHVPALRGGRA